MREYSETELVKSKEYKSLITDAEEAVRRFFPKTGGLGFGGMAGTSYPKKILKTVAGMIEEGKFEGRGYHVYGGGSTSDAFDSWIDKLNISKRYPLAASSPKLRTKANSRQFEVADIGLYEHSRWIRTGLYERLNGKMELAIVEASGITEEGHVIPPLSVDSAPSSIQMAENVIVEVNTRYGILSGLHDIYYLKKNNLTPISKPTDRIGTPYYDIPKSKIKAVVLSDEIDSENTHYRGVSPKAAKIANSILNTINSEIRNDPTLANDYFTLQPGAGPISSSLNERISEINADFYVWGEVVPSSWIINKGDNVMGISASVVYDLPGDRKYREVLLANLDEFSKDVILRPYEICNSPEMISRFSHITLQQAIEIDVFGGANISHIGNNIYGGIGGSVDHSRPAHLVILALPSTTGNGKVSRIVPFIFNLDIPHQDIDVIVTENGVADIRGLSPLRRVEQIINNCASDSFKDPLWDYYEHLKSVGGQQPMDIRYYMNLARDLGLEY